MKGMVRTLEQRRQALLLANDVRTYRAHLKRDVKAGLVDFRGVVTNPDPRVLTMKVWDLLLAVPAVGRCKADQALRRSQTSPSKTVGGITDRQRTDLLRALEPSPYRLRKMAA